MPDPGAPSLRRGKPAAVPSDSANLCFNGRPQLLLLGTLVMMNPGSTERSTDRITMRRRRKKSSSIGGGILLVVAILLAVLLDGLQAGDTWAIGVAVALGVAPFAAYIIYIVSNMERGSKLRAIQLANVDDMKGVEFENYVKALLMHRGFTVETTKATGDLGVDLVASRNHERIAIQVKRQKDRVSRRAVSDAVAGIAHYHCTTAMVVTNSYLNP